jgi:isopentenyl diphosphate isomerase/L-lactate dehydrogenase-like FMN-dependent dehydrogenase
MTHDAARREFIKFLALSPYVAAAGGVGAFLRMPSASAQGPGAVREVITSPANALSVFDFEEPARRNVAQGHWAYMASGVDDDATLRANREIFSHVQLRPRRLHDATLVDTKVQLFGTTYSSPIFLCPTGGEGSFFPAGADGEVAVARAAAKRGTLQCLSTMATKPIEDVNKALGRPVWFQLYAPSRWEACEQLLRRVEAAGTTVVMLTCDNTTGRNSETYLRQRPRDLSQCVSCHGPGEPGGKLADKSMFKGIDMTGARAPYPAMDWAFVDRLRKFWKGKLIIKGIDTHEDAAMAVERGFDGILVSNHGGRSTETLRSTLEALPEVVGEVRGRIPVFVDGGFRRGTDIFKGLALGATAVGVGRPFLWGLGAFGDAGVERVIEILQGELRLAMGNCGTRRVADITRAYVASPDRKL